MATKGSKEFSKFIVLMQGIDIEESKREEFLIVLDKIMSSLERLEGFKTVISMRNSEILKDLERIKTLCSLTFRQTYNLKERLNTSFEKLRDSVS